MSKDSVVTASNVSRSLIGRSTRIDSRRLASAPCVTWTPLGLPVEPEV